MAKMLRFHALACGVVSTFIVATTYGELMSLFMGSMYLMHMTCITFLLLLLYGTYIFTWRPCISCYIIVLGYA